MKKIFVLWCLTLISFSYGATIKGHVYDEDTMEPIAGANIFIKDLHTGASTDMNGFFVIENVPTGEHIVQIMYIGFWDSIDTISVKDSSEVISIEKKLSFSSPKIDTDMAIENYHQYLQKLQPESILKITLDSITIDDSEIAELKVYSTFYNETDTPVYVIANMPRFYFVTGEIKNSSNEKINENVGLFHCVERELPLALEFIKIDPHSSIKYPPVYLDLYYFSKYPRDVYSVKLKYYYARPDRLPGLLHNQKGDYKIPMYYFNMALRGEYLSSNSLQFDNSKYSQVK
ncbi:MAG: carboxypeptidase-like regulatory domain-containing protein [Ignavibacteriaceae bacterium]|nr:carboxypeptidase-like regulatory domain-containing protein [Ignavibacteriaceae bacterium]